MASKKAKVKSAPAKVAPAKAAVAQVPVRKPLRERPLSPHLTIYKPQNSSISSISHRIAGLVLFVGLFGVVVSVLALAWNPDLFNYIQQFAQTIFGQVIHLGGFFCACYHLANGVRHLFWDAGYGLNVKVIGKTFALVLFTAALLTASIAYLIYARNYGGI